MPVPKQALIRKNRVISRKEYCTVKGRMKQDKIMDYIKGTSPAKLRVLNLYRELNEMVYTPGEQVDLPIDLSENVLNDYQLLDSSYLSSSMNVEFGKLRLVEFLASPVTLSKDAGASNETKAQEKWYSIPQTFKTINPNHIATMPSL